MKETEAPFRAVAGGVEIAVKLKPGSSRKGIAGVEGERLAVTVHARPTGGEANRALIRVLADAIGVPPSSVVITGGVKSRAKTVLVEGVSLEAVAGGLGIGLESV
ncbi:MAG: DUF167 domain-containing protein [Candidatus Geothermincolia bacterium]